MAEAQINIDNLSSVKADSDYKFKPQQRVNIPVDMETVKGYSTNSTSVRPYPQEEKNEEEESISEDYNMVCNIFNYNEVRKSTHFAIKIFNKAIYRGEMQDGVRHGRG